MANPTCPERVSAIMTSLPEQPDYQEKPEQPPAGGAKEATGLGLDCALESVIAALETTKLDSDKVVCKCTRKCATMTCPCKKSLKSCTEMCHPKNIKCQNK